MERVSDATGVLSVLTPAGEPIVLASLWAERPTLIVLVRHYGCQFCREQVAQLRRIIPALAQAGVGIAIIGNGTPLMAQAFIEETGLDVPLFTNPGREVYHALGARRPSVLALLDPRLWLNGARAVARGYLPRRPQGDTAQLGGVFLVLPDGSMPYAYRSERGGDYPSNAEVLDAVGSFPRTTV
ncbi:MAG: SelL-related redox protein [Dehalococcoidia bacterium]